MDAINGALQTTHESFFFSIDPKSLVLSQNSISNLSFQRGPRYKAYAELRESKLRMKHNQQQQPPPLEEPKFTLTPTKKRVTFQGDAPVSDRNRASVVARSVPDFSAVLRKENRNPLSALEMTPPPSKASNTSRMGRSKSMSGGEKKGSGGGLMVRKSYASVEELKGLASGVASAINGEGKGGGGRSTRGSHKTVLASRRY